MSITIIQGPLINITIDQEDLNEAKIQLKQNAKSLGQKVEPIARTTLHGSVEVGVMASELAAKEGLKKYVAVNAPCLAPCAGVIIEPVVGYVGGQAKGCLHEQADHSIDKYAPKSVNGSIDLAFNSTSCVLKKGGCLSQKNLSN